MKDWLADLDDVEADIAYIKVTWELWGEMPDRDVDSVALSELAALGYEIPDEV
jgi:hypothetical protein